MTFTATPLDVAKARQRVIEDEQRALDAARHRRKRSNLESALVRTAGLLGMRLRREVLRDRSFLDLQVMLRDAEQAVLDRDLS